MIKGDLSLDSIIALDTVLEIQDLEIADLVRISTRDLYLSLTVDVGHILSGDLAFVLAMQEAC